MCSKKLTVNYHLVDYCNYSCKYCYASFKKDRKLSLNEKKIIIDKIKDFSGVRKINFAGGEPLLDKDLGDLILYAKNHGFIVSIITNGKYLTESFLDKYGKYIDIIGISCDSNCNTTMNKIGRGVNDGVEVVRSAYKVIDSINAKNNLSIRKKLNTVVTQYNFTENLSDILAEFDVDRWKIFQVLKIDGMNDKTFNELKTNEFEFQSFLARHSDFNDIIVSEDNQQMENSYLMINPSGYLYQNSGGSYSMSESLLETSFSSALKQVGFSTTKFFNRNAFYL